MSRKYGSLHVRLENGVAAVKQGYIGAMEAVFPVNVAQAAERLGLSLSQEQLPILNRLIQAGLSFRAQPKVAEHLGFVSVYCAYRITYYRNITREERRRKSRI